MLQLDITDDLIKCICEIKEKNVNANKPQTKIEENEQILVYYEKCGNVLHAINYKKKLQKWDDIWKIILIEKFNPCWEDLYEDLKYNYEVRGIKITPNIVQKLGMKFQEIKIIRLIV